MTRYFKVLAKPKFLMHPILISLVLLIVSAIATRSSLAQEVMQPNGRIAATAYGPVSKDATISIVFREDSDLNHRLKAIFDKELTGQGYRIGDTGDLVLTFETLVEEKIAPDKPARVLGRGGSRSGAELGFQYRLTLSKPKLVVGGRRYSLNASLAQPKQAPIWIASAVAVTSYGERFTVQRAMVKAVVEAFGESVSRQSIVIE